MRLLLLAAISAVIGVSHQVEIRVASNCDYPIWVEAAPNNGQDNLVNQPVRLDKGQAYAFQIPARGWSGRFWPKVECDGGGQNCLFGQSSPPCPSDGCQPPADTKIEFFFPANQNEQSWYDISLVDGYSQGVFISPRDYQDGTCIRTDCHTLSLNSCPQYETNGLFDLRVFRNGRLVGCLSPCKKWNYPPPYGYGNPELNDPGVWMCCPTPPISPQQCSSGPVINTDYVKLVHATCPTAYSYAYDDEAGLHACPGWVSFDATFCP